jgi:hypothetical protein
VQSPLKDNTSNRKTAVDSVISKLPGPNVTNWLLEGPIKEKDDGCGLLPVTIILNGNNGQLTPKQSSLINSVSDVPAVGIPLLTLFAALSLHEPETGLPAPAVSQLAVCLVVCPRSLESAIFTYKSLSTVLNKSQCRERI